MSPGLTVAWQKKCVGKQDAKVNVTAFLPDINHCGAAAAAAAWEMSSLSGTDSVER